MKVAIAQICPIKGDFQANIQKHLEWIRHAKQKGVHVLLFPELSLTGYDLRNSAPDIAVEVDDEGLCLLARESGEMITIAGFVELGFAAQLFNAAIVLRHGKSLFVHRKLNLPNYGKLEEGKHFSSGRYLETFLLRRSWYANILTCADVWNPALVHLAAVKGATILLAPLNSATGTMGTDFSNPDGWDLAMRFYAHIYGLPILMANRVGKEDEYQFWGRSKIVNAQGEIIKEATGANEEMLVADLSYRDVVKTRAKLPTVRDSNLDLIHRELSRAHATIGRPERYLT